MRGDNLQLLDILEKALAENKAKAVMGNKYFELASYRDIIIQRLEKFVIARGLMAESFVYDAYNLITSEYIEKRLKESLRKHDVSMIEWLLHINSLVCRKISKSIFSAIKLIVSNIQDKERRDNMNITLRSVCDASFIARKAKFFYDEGEYLKAYNHYRMAGKLNRKLVDDIILKLYSEGSTLSISG